MRGVRVRNLAADVSRQPRLQRGAEALLGRLTCSVLVLALLAGCDGERVNGRKRTGVAHTVPKTLADASEPATLPIALRRFRGRPVLGAKELSARSNPIRS